MRNLKRVLSLALATVMLLGMMVVGAGAADAKVEAPKATALTDLDKAVNKQAVNLMVDLGIIVGKPDGTFDPAGTVDRATMAKLITYIMMGDVDAGLFEGTTTDLKDIDKSWAKGYIKYCYANKIIGGDGKGNFFPTNGVTAAEASKMLLVAIGYDAKAQGYEGDSWSINVMRDAKIAGLLAGVTAKTNDPLTRDNAAQMIFNALMSPTVKYETQYDGGVAYKANPTTKTGALNNDTLGQLQYDLKPAAITGVVTANQANTGSTLKGKTTISGDNANTYATATTLADLGKTVSFYEFKVAGKTTYSTQAFATSKNKVVTIPTGLTTTDKQNKFLNTNALTISNGPALDATITDYVYASGKTSVITDLNITNNAIVANVIDNNGDGKIDVIVKNAKKLAKVTGEVKTKTATDGAVTTYVPGVTGSYETVIGATDLVKNDFVTWIKIGDVYEIAKCATVEGKVTGYKGTDTVYVDGTAYLVSSIANADFNAAAEYVAMGYKATAKFWMDDNKNLVFAKKTSGESTYNTAVVLGYSTTASSTAENVGTAKLLLPDGTVETVEIASFKEVDSSGVAGAVVTAWADGFGAATANTDFGDNYKLAAYTVDDDGKYVLLNLVEDNDKVDTTVYKLTEMTDHYITPGAANFLGASAASDVTTVVGNANTVFIVATWNTAGTKVTGYTAFTGIANAPKYLGASAGTGAAGQVLAADGVAKLVFISGGANISIGKDSKFVYTAANAVPAYNGADKTYVYATGAYVDGVETKDLASKILLTAGTVQKVELNDDGVIVAANAAETFAKPGVKYLKGVVAVNTSDAAHVEYLTYTDSVVVVVINEDGSKNVANTIDVANIETDNNDTVYFAKDATGKVTSLYITKTAAVAPTVTYGTHASAVDDWSTAMPAAGTETNLTAGQVLAFQAVAAAGTTVTSISVTTAAAPTVPVIKTDATGALANTVKTADYTIADGDLGTTGAGNTKTATVVVLYTDGTVTSSVTYTLNLI